MILADRKPYAATRQTAVHERAASGNACLQTCGIMAVIKKKKPKTLKIVLVLFILSIIGVVTIVYINYRKLIKNPEKLITEFKPGVDMTIDDIHQTATRNGKKEWQLDATSARYFDAEKKVRLDNIGMTFFLEDQQEIHLTADSGTLETESQNVSVQGQVDLKNQTRTFRPRRFTINTRNDSSHQNHQ